MTANTTQPPSPEAARIRWLIDAHEDALYDFANHPGGDTSDALDVTRRDLNAEITRVMAVVETAVDWRGREEDMVAALRRGDFAPSNGQVSAQRYGVANRAALDAKQRFDDAVDVYRKPIAAGAEPGGTA